MPFDNFYNESDKVDRNARLLGLFVFLLVAAFIGSIYFIESFLLSVPHKDSTDNETPTKAERLLLADALCRELPKPERFVFTERNPPLQYVGATAVVYFYTADRDFNEVMPTFFVWFNSNGWQRVAENHKDVYSTANNQIRFMKGNQIVTISYYDYVYPNYKIHCQVRSGEVYD